MKHFPAKNPNPVLSVEKDGTVLYSNEASKPLLYEWGAKIGEKLPSSIVDILQKVITQNNPEKIEVKAGNSTYLLSLHHLPEEECINIYGFDISCQKELEEKLRNSEERLLLAQQVAKIGTFEWDIQTGVNVWTPELEAMYGLRPGEFGKTQSAWEQLVHPDDRQKAISTVESAFYTNEPVEGEWGVVWPDGSVHWLIGRFQILRDEASQPRRLTGVNIDVTERKRAEEALHKANERLQAQSEELQVQNEKLQTRSEELKEANNALSESEVRFRTMANAIPQLAWIAQPDGYIYWYNERWYAYTGTTLEQMEGWGWKSVHDPAVLPEVLEQWKASIATGQPFDMEFPLRGADGLFRMFLTRAIPLKDANGRVLQWFGTNTDIIERKRAEEALKLTQASVDMAADYILWITPNGKVIYANNAACKSLKYSRDELQEMYVWDFDLIYTKEVWLEHWLDIKKRGAFSFESLHHAKDMREFPVEVSVNYVRSGDMEFNFAYIKDITERKKAEEALKETHDNLEEKVKERTAELEKAYNSLKESERSLAEAQRMAHIGNWDWNLVTGEVYWSDELYRIFGRSPQESGATYNEFLSYVHPDDRDHVNNAIKKGLNGEPIAGDYRIILANGEERIVHTEAEVIFNEENNPIQMKGTVQDITESKKAEEKIRILANIVESSNDAIGTMSLDGNITSWNQGAEHVYGYSLEEILGKPVSILAPPHLDKETIKLIEEIKHGKKIQHYETLRLRKDGKTIYVSITLSPVFDTYGKLTAISFISRDITERKKVEEKLLESEEKYRNIVETANEGISHN